MPYKSDSQRRFFHTDTAKKAGITDKEVNEFDQASKGKKLPEKKMAYGGETNAKKETVKSMKNNPTAGFANGGLVHSLGDSDNGTLAGLRDLLERAQRGEDIHEAPKMNPENEDKEGKFLGEFNANASTEPVKGYSEGGLVAAFEKLLGSKGDSAVKSDKSEAAAADAIDPVVTHSTDTAHGYADGGPILPPLDTTGAGFDVNTGDTNPVTMQGLPNSVPLQAPPLDNDFIHKMNMGTAMTPPPAVPTANPIMQAGQAAQGMAATSPNIYQGISAEDRAALLQKLLAQKASGGNLAASGAGGLADAITGAFGKQPTNFQQQIRGAQQQNIGNQMNVMDTERQQKLQDIQAKIAVQESDPNSPYSQGMRNFLQLQGMKVPSGMSASMLKQTLPDVTKIFDSKMIALTAGGAQQIEAGKALMGETFADWLKEELGVPGAEQGQEYLSNRVGGSTTPNTSGWKVVR